MAEKPDFGKVWAQNSPLPEYKFSDSDYLEGWNFVGSIPPARGMFDALQRQTDEKLRYLDEHGDEAIAAAIAAHNAAADAHADLRGAVDDKADKTELSKYLPLAGGEMTGGIGFSGTARTISHSGDDLTYGGKKIKSMAFPSSTRVSCGITASGQNYTAPADGYIYASGSCNSTTSAYIKIDTPSMSARTFGNGLSNAIYMFIPVKKNDVVNVQYEQLNSIGVVFVFSEGEV